MREKRFLTLFLATLLALALATAQAQALSLQRQSLSQLTKNNSTIVTGKVVDAYSYWNADGSWIVTDFRVQPNDVIKGAVKNPDLTVTMLGGTVGETSVLVPGTASLEVGKSYLLFVSQADMPGVPGAKVLRGHTQNVFDLIPTKDGALALSQASDSPLQPDADGKTAAVGGTDGMYLEALKSAIQELIADTVEK